MWEGVFMQMEGLNMVRIFARLPLGQKIRPRMTRAAPAFKTEHHQPCEQHTACIPALEVVFAVRVDRLATLLEHRHPRAWRTSLRWSNDRTLRRTSTAVRTTRPQVSEAGLSVVLPCSPIDRVGRFGACIFFLWFRVFWC